MLAAVERAAVPDNRDYRPTCSLGLAALPRNALSRDITRRPASAAMRTELSRAVVICGSSCAWYCFPECLQTTILPQSDAGRGGRFRSPRHGIERRRPAPTHFFHSTRRSAMH